MIRSKISNTTLYSLFLLSPLGLGCGGEDVSEPQIESVQSNIRGTASNHHPVVGLQFGRERCSGTAIAHNVVVSAEHCLRNGDNISVLYATGSNSSAVGATAIDIRTPPSPGGISVGNSTVFPADMVFLEFPANTFSSTYSFTVDIRPANRVQVRLVGWAGRTRNSNTVEVTNSGETERDGLLYRSLVTTNDDGNGQSIAEPGDSGGAVLLNGSQLIAVIAGIGRNEAHLTAFRSAAQNALTDLLNR